MTDNTLVEECNDVDRLVALTVNSDVTLNYLREGRKINAIKELRLISKHGDIYAGLTASKAAVEDERVLSVLEHARVHLVQDAEGERLEFFGFREDAEQRVTDLNEAYGEGFAFFDTHEVLGFGQRPQPRVIGHHVNGL